MLSKGLIAIIIVLAIQSVVLPHFTKVRFLIYIIPVITIIYGIKDSFFERSFPNSLWAFLVYLLLAFIFLMSAYVSRNDIEKKQEKSSTAEQSSQEE